MILFYHDSDIIATTQIRQDFVQTNSKTSQKGGLTVGLPDLRFICNSLHLVIWGVFLSHRFIIATT